MEGRCTTGRKGRIWRVNLAMVNFAAKTRPVDDGWMMESDLDTDGRVRGVRNSGFHVSGVQGNRWCVWHIPLFI